ncbi:hypothetical protein GGH96_005642 [Coemansia sp. RSA 1972]|nr:hypothetical protein GGH96_005642 [Coemansia sp. RSA 1972]
MDTIILVHHILKDEYAPATDKQSATTTKKQAVSNDEPALRVFKDHPHHTFNKFITTDGVSLCVVHRTVEATLAKKAAGKKHKRSQLAQQEQQPAQQAQLLQLPTYSAVQPPAHLMTVQSLVEQTWIIAAYREQQAWKMWEVWEVQVSPVQLTWVPVAQQAQQTWMLVAQQAWEAWEEWQAWIQLSSPPVQPSDQLVKPVKQQQKKADCLYIDELSQEYLQSTVGRSVLVDPGQWDLLFAMRKDSTIENKQIYRYTKCQQHILEQVKKADKAGIAEAECTLGTGSFIKPNLALFKEYLAAQAKVEAKLTVFYNKTMSWQQDGATTPEVLLHRKLQFSVYIRCQQADDRLVKQLRAKFKPEKTDPEPIFIMGDWSAPMTRFHKPIRGKGWRRLLKHASFDVYLIDEYLTSKLCLNCNERLSNTHYVPNLRLWMRSKRPKPAEASTASKPTKARKTTASKPNKASKTTARKASTANST